VSLVLVVWCLPIDDAQRTALQLTQVPMIELLTLDSDMEPTAPGGGILVLDLDETLVHTDRDMHVHPRPGCYEFLRVVAAAFDEVAIFTASLQPYADPILDYLEAASGVRFGRRLYRESCTLSSAGYYAKDLRLFGADMARIVLVDNLRTSYSLQPDNGIPIKDWLANPGDEDDELRHLALFLRDKVATADDVRVVLRRHFSNPW
jgi:Dullard-like phosphatase family protein